MSQVDTVLRRIVEAGLASEDFGDPDSETGRILLVEIPEDAEARASIRQTVFAGDAEEDYLTDSDVFDRLEAGWYFGTMRTGGSVFFYEALPKGEASNHFKQEKDNYEDFSRLGW